jgi:hypothetical protein
MLCKAEEELTKDCDCFDIDLESRAAESVKTPPRENAIATFF